MRRNGFTLIELLIALAIIGIILSMVIRGVSSEENSLSWGWNGVTETRCIAGYEHVVGAAGQARQVLNSEGKGIPCGK